LCRVDFSCFITCFELPLGPLKMFPATSGIQDQGVKKGVSQSSPLVISVICNSELNVIKCMTLGQQSDSRQYAPCQGQTQCPTLADPVVFQ